MKEKLYTIPVNDAFSTDCECPVCTIYNTLEQNAVAFAMGPSYMEDDVRMETDQTGFCQKHMRLLWAQNNKLGLALVTKTHMDRTSKELRELMLKKTSSKGGFFKKKEENPIISYIERLEHSCFICSRIQTTFDRYILTIFHLWKTDPAFQQTFVSSKGLCTNHLGLLLKQAPKHLNGNALAEFEEAAQKVYIDNMERVIEDVEWFINKFDYRYNDEPWKNAKDALPRALTKVNGLLDIDKPEKS